MTMTSMGCHPLSVITAVTVQDSVGVEDLLPIDAEWVADQGRVLLEDMPVAAFKLGLLASLENIAAVAEIIADYPSIPVILDPVLTSGRGDEFATDDMVVALRELLVPQTTVLTPNSIEARRLAAEDDEEGEPDLDQCAARLTRAGAEYVLITGSHENTPKVINVLYGKRGRIRSDSWDRFPGSYHGSGCTLASAIAASLATGLDVSDAVRAAQDYTWHTLARGFRPGMGQYIPDRFFWARDEQQ